MEALRAHRLDELALEAVGAGRPFLGICIGMQMLFEASEESPGASGLGILPGTVRLIPGDVKRPQMQWNRLERRGDPELLRLIPDPAWAYFVHSYAADTDDAVVTATCDYGGDVVAAVEQGSVWATQFHPEKSSRTGLAVLQAFVDRCAATVPATT
jgi:glutamine amidotransferase